MNYTLFFVKLREKRKKIMETMRIEPGSPGWEVRVLTITPSGNLQENAQNLTIDQSSTIFHYIML